MSNEKDFEYSSKTASLMRILSDFDKDMIAPDSEKFDDFVAILRIQGKSIPINELAALQSMAKDISDRAKRKQVKADAVYDVLRLQLVPEAMNAMGITSINVINIGRVTVTTDFHARVLSGKTSESLQWLDENGYGDLIKETVHPSTLKAFMKECITNGTELPGDIFEMTPFDRASITKK